VIAYNCAPLLRTVAKAGCSERREKSCKKQKKRLTGWVGLVITTSRCPEVALQWKRESGSEKKAKKEIDSQEQIR